MKTLIALVVLCNVTAVSAQHHRVPPYYSAKYKITKVSPMCPRTVPTGAHCMGLGSIVQIEATIGCTDTVKHKNIEVIGNTIHTDVHVKRDPNADRIRCYRAQVLKETVLVHSMGKVTIVNDGIQF